MLPRAMFCQDDSFLRAHGEKTSLAGARIKKQTKNMEAAEVIEQTKNQTQVPIDLAR